MDALRRFWAASLLNKVTLLLTCGLVFCCCGTFRISGVTPSVVASGAPYVAACTRARPEAPAERAFASSFISQHLNQAARLA